MRNPLRPLYPYLAKYKKRYAIGFTALIVTQVVGVTVPLIIKDAIDGLTRGITSQALLFFAGLLLGVALVKAVFQFWMRWMLIGISRDVEYDLRNDLFRHLMRLDQAYYNEHRTGDLMSKLTNDLNAVRNIVGPGIMYSANTVVVGIATITLMAHLDPRLTLLAIAPLPLASIAVKFFGQRIHERFEKIQAMYSVLTEKVRESLAGVRLVRSFCQEEAENREFDRMNQQFVDKNKRLIWITSFLWPALALLFAGSFLLIMVVGGEQVISGRITVGTFAAFNIYLMYLIWPIIALGWVTNIIQRGLASLGRLWTIFASQPGIDDRYVPENPVTTIEGEIEFRNLTFSYNGYPILKDINLRIPPGRTVAIVGATGSGKSTLAALVPRLYESPAGSVLVDGIPVRQFPLKTLRSHIGFVPQETFLFSNTIQENIRFGASDSSREEVAHAADISNILPDIMSFPKGFDTTVGERGLTLSGGQKQRVAISRAILRDPRILILDDALSSVDTYTEEKILQHLTGVMAGRTTILISHRISTIRNADEIVVLHDGTIVEKGSHEELLAMNGYYSELYNKQLIEEALEKET
ncbi:MAG: ABC transporter ATP-binding protein/permease [Acidobacteria bacterium]|nr:ABC transporter ATP-binding protein/permease [Acidobacteriota bacterium]